MNQHNNIETNRIPLRALEFHVSFGCNLTCESCSHFSNHSHALNIDPDQLKKQISLWNKKIDPKKFCLLGGEPTLNKYLLDLIIVARDGWKLPNFYGSGSTGSQLELITNGLLLSRFPELPKVLEETGCKLIISIHHNSPEYLEKLQPVVDLVKQWQDIYDFEVTWRPSFDKWSRRYYGYGSEMKPYRDHNQRQSWVNCTAKYCVQLFDGKLWKCPPIAYLPMQHDKYKISDEWHPYLKYIPLEAEVSLSEISEFLSREDESICLMCPANPTVFTKPNPLRKASV